MAAPYKSLRSVLKTADAALRPEPETPTLRLVRTADTAAAPVRLVESRAVVRPPRLGLDPRRFVLNLMIVAAAICLYHGITEPIIKLTQLFVFSDTHSLASAVLALYEDGEWFLATIVLIFSMLMPTAKLLYLLALGSLSPEHLRQRHGWLKRLEWFGKWSMHDVLILSLSIVYLRAEGISQAVSMPGVRWFAAAVILIMLAYGWLKREARQGGDAAVRAALADSAQPDPYPRPSELFRFLLGLLTLSAAGMLVLGITLPAIQLTKLYWWTDRHSILSAIAALEMDKEYFLAGLIGLFSVVIPACKLTYLLAVSTLAPRRPANRERTLERLESLGKWSMMDVLVLALMVFYVNASSLADATALPGIYCYAASVFLTMAAYNIARNTLSSRPRRLRRTITLAPVPERG